jgi:hypothetical protein
MVSGCSKPVDELVAYGGGRSFIKDFFKCYERNYRKNNYKIDIARKIPLVRNI